MSFSTCPTCFNTVDWSWEEAFDKFGFGDGDGLVMTEHVAAALRKNGYVVTTHTWGSHNTIITSIVGKRGKELIPASANVGYDDPREYLPIRIRRLLDEAFSGGEVEL